MKPKHGFRRHLQGFTLVEILIVIAIIGVMAAIAIPELADIGRTATNSKDRRNAQSAAMIYASARAAGATFNSAPADKEGIVNELIAGKTGAGSLSSGIFRLPGLSATEANALLPYLEFNNEVGITYRAGE